MRVTAIKAQVKNAGRVSIYIDEKYALSLTHNQLLESKIHNGKELSSEDVAELKRSSDYGKLLERTMSYVMIRPHSVLEVRDYLRRKKAEPDVAEKIITHLEIRGYLGDAAFARSWVRARQLTKPVSKRRLTSELLQKGVASELIEQAMSGEAYDEVSALQDIITKKRRQPRYQDEQKLMAYLARQGFGYDVIRAALSSEEN